MKVIFLKDVPKLGRRHDIKEVNDGYAANYLFPQKLAEPATTKRIAEIEKMKQTMRVEKAVRDDLLTKHLTLLKDVAITMHRKANDSGHLFSGIKPEDIAETLAKHKVELSPDAIKLDRPIKELGSYHISVEVNGKTSSFSLSVERS